MYKAVADAMQSPIDGSFPDETWKIAIEVFLTMLKNGCSDDEVLHIVRHIVVSKDRALSVALVQLMTVVEITSRCRKEANLFLLHHVETNDILCDGAVSAHPPAPEISMSVDNVVEVCASYWRHI